MFSHGKCVLYIHTYTMCSRNPRQHKFVMHSLDSARFFFIFSLSLLLWRRCVNIYIYTRINVYGLFQWRRQKRVLWIQAASSPQMKNGWQNASRASCMERPTTVCVCAYCAGVHKSSMARQSMIIMWCKSFLSVREGRRRLSCANSSFQARARASVKLYLIGCAHICIDVSILLLYGL